MRMKRILPVLLVLAASSCARAPRGPLLAANAGEDHLTNIRQLTFGGQNAEAYFSSDGKWLTYQASSPGMQCDQQFVMRTDGSRARRISNGGGKTTCGYFYDGDRRVFFASTHGAAPECPPAPDYSQGYVWRLDDYDIWSTRPDGSDLQRLTN